MKRLQVAMLAGSLVAMAAQAGACGSCVASQLEPALPPVVPWSIIGGLGFIAVSAFARPTAGRTLTANLCSPWTALVVVLVALFGANMLGPVPGLALLCIAIAALVIRWREPERPRRGPLVVATLLAAALLTTGIVSTVQASRRDDVDWIVRWGGSPQGRVLFKKMEERKDLESLRRLLMMEEQADFEASRAAETLGRIGEPAVDGPLLEAEIARLSLKIPASTWIETYRTALAELKKRGGEGAAESTPPTQQ